MIPNWFIWWYYNNKEVICVITISIVFIIAVIAMVYLSLPLAILDGVLVAVYVAWMFYAEHIVNKD